MDRFYVSAINACPHILYQNIYYSYGVTLVWWGSCRRHNFSKDSNIWCHLLASYKQKRDMTEVITWDSLFPTLDLRWFHVRGHSGTCACVRVYETRLVEHVQDRSRFQVPSWVWSHRQYCTSNSIHKLSSLYMLQRWRIVARIPPSPSQRCFYTQLSSRNVTRSLIYIVLQANKKTIWLLLKELSEIKMRFQ